MTTIGLSEVQKNIGMISKIKKPVKVRDNRKNIDVAVIYPYTEKKKNIVDIGGSLKPSEKISKKSKDMSFNDIKKEAMKTYFKKGK